MRGTTFRLPLLALLPLFAIGCEETSPGDTGGASDTGSDTVPYTTTDTGPSDTDTRTPDTDTTDTDTTDTDTTDGCARGDQGILAGSTQATLCGERASWALDLPDASCHVVVDLSGDGTLGLEADGTALTSLATSYGAATLSLAHAGGTAGVWVEGSGTVDLSVTTTCSADAPTCPAEDVYEDNDLDETAIWMPQGAPVEGVVCDVNDWDVFAFEAAPGCAIDVTVDTTYADEENIDLYLDVLDPQYGTWDTWRNALTETDDERIQEVARRTHYHARVLGTNGRGRTFEQGSYAVQVDLDCSPVSCPSDDRHEGPRGNDTVVDSVEVAPGEVLVGAACAGNDDVFLLNGNACAPTVVLTWDAAQGDLDAQLLVGADNPLPEKFVAREDLAPGVRRVGAASNLLSTYFVLSGDDVPYEAAFSCE